MARKIKKTIPWFLVFVLIGLAIVVGLNLGKPTVKATDVPTTVTVGNAAPTWTTDAYEDPDSTSAAPTNSGTNVTFKAIASDPNADQYYLAICKAEGISAGDDAAPTCTGGNWCISTATNDDAEASCTYQVQDADAESQVWYGYICDKVSGGGACNTTYKNTNSPFKVNRRPSFTVFQDDSPVNPAATVTWTTTASDSDTDGTPDTVSLYVCKANDFTGTACGGGGTWCSATGQASNPSCNTSAPRPDGDYNAYGFVIDNHNFAASGGSQGTDSTLTVNNVAPGITNTTIQLQDTDGAGNLTLTVVQGETTDFLVKFVVTDNNSCLNITSGNEIASALIHVRMSEIAQASCDDDAEDNNNNCYANAHTGTGGTCVQDTSINDCTGNTDTDVGWRCEFPLQYHVDPTTGTPTPPKNAYNWTVAVQATDDDSANTGLVDDDDGNELGEFLSFGYSESSIAYGALAPGQSSSSSQTATIVEKGNCGLDAEYSGTDMTYSSYNIPVAQQKYGFTDTTWDSLTYTLSVTATERELDCLKTITTGSPQTKATYFRIKIPDGQQTGDYSGTDTLSGVVSEDNWQ